MTEDEAKTKMCCGPPAVAASAYYRAGAACDAPMHCIGSACAAWRWAAEHRGRVVGKSGQDFEADDCRGYATAFWTVTPLPSVGYCGLAGEAR